MPRLDRTLILAALLKARKDTGLDDLCHALGIDSKPRRQNLLVLLTHLKRDRLVRSPARGVYRITPAGDRWLAQRNVQAAPDPLATPKSPRKANAPAPQKQRPESAILGHVDGLVDAIVARVLERLTPRLVSAIDAAAELASLDVATRPDPKPVASSRPTIPAPTQPPQPPRPAPPPPSVPPPPAPIAPAAVAAPEVAAPQSVPAEPPATAKAPRIKVAVVGLLAAQVHMIEREFKSRLDITFVSTAQRGATKIRRAIDRAEFILLMIGFIEHGHSDIARRAPGAVVNVTGGMTSLRRSLESISSAQKMETAS